jgi:hypothetical protein
VLEFLRGRDDVVVFGATAVNAYVDEPRMTQDIDLMSTRAPELAEELRANLSARFTIAVRIREVAKAKGYRLFQIQKSGNRDLVDVRSVAELPKANRVQEISIASPPELMAQKVFSYCSRRGQPKGFSDMRDLAVLFLAFPELKSESGPVLDVLHVLDANDEVIETWRELVTQEIREPTPDSEFE